MSSIKKNFFYNASYQILVLILPIITSPYISRVMGAEKMGEYSYSSSIASYFGMFIVLGLSNYGNRTIASTRQNKQQLSKSFWSIYAMQLFMGIFILIFYMLYVCFIAKNKLMAQIQIIFLISEIIDISWFFFGMEQFKLTVTRNTVLKIVSVICIFIFVRDSDDLYKYTLIMVISSIMNQIFLWLFLNKYVFFVLPKLNDIKKHIIPNIILFIPVIAVSIYTTMAKIILGTLYNTVEVGYFESASKLTIIPGTIVAALGTVMLPKVSNLVASGKESESIKYLQKSLIISVFLSTSMALGLSAISKEFVPVFYGSGFEKCKILIPILVLSSIFIAWANVIRTQYLIPYKKDKIYIQSVFLGAGVNILINIVLIPYLQSVGAALGTLFAEIIVAVYQTFKIRKNLNIKLFLKQSLPFVIIGIIMYIIVIQVPFIEYNIITIITKIIIGGVIYLSLSFIYYKILLRDL